MQPARPFNWQAGVAVGGVAIGADGVVDTITAIDRATTVDTMVAGIDLGTTIPVTITLTVVTTTITNAERISKRRGVRGNIV